MQDFYHQHYLETLSYMTLYYIVSYYIVWYYTTLQLPSASFRRASFCATFSCWFLGAGTQHPKSER